MKKKDFETQTLLLIKRECTIEVNQPDLKLRTSTNKTSRENGSSEESLLRLIQSVCNKYHTNKVANDLTRTTKSCPLTASDQFFYLLYNPANLLQSQSNHAGSNYLESKNEAKEREKPYFFTQTLVELVKLEGWFVLESAKNP